jgi:hypothetical protein
MNTFKEILFFLEKKLKIKYKKIKIKFAMKSRLILLSLLCCLLCGYLSEGKMFDFLFEVYLAYYVFVIIRPTICNKKRYSLLHCSVYSRNKYENAL